RARPPAPPSLPYTTLFRSFGIRKDVVEFAVADAPLTFLPVAGVEQVGVMLHEQLAHPRVAEQESAELLREHVVRSHRVPRLRRRSEEHTSELQSRENLVCR